MPGGKCKFMAGVLLMGLLVACEPTSSSESKVTRGPSSSEASESPMPKGRLVIGKVLSIPAMKGWSVIDSNAVDLTDCDPYHEEGVIAQCPQIGAEVNQAAHADEGRYISMYLPCAVMKQDATPVGVDMIGGLRANRYRVRTSDCVPKEQLEKSVVRVDAETTAWVADKGSKRYIIKTYDGTKGRPKLDMDKVRFALAHAEWLD